MALPINARDYQLSNGEFIQIGVNFRALELMAQYPGGLNKLRKTMEQYATAGEDSEEYDQMIIAGTRAMGYMLWCLIRAGGTECTVEDAEMAIGLGDFMQLMEIFDEFSEQMERISPNVARRAMAGMKKNQTSSG